MNISDIWWTRVEGIANIPEKIKTSLEENKSVFFVCDNALPWKETFYDKMNKEISAVSADKSLVSVSGAGVSDPGEMLINKMCSSAAREKYWPDVSFAEFLASQSDIMLNTRIVWVSDIRGRQQAAQWLNFIRDYNEYVKNYDHSGALFVIECYPGNDEIALPDFMETVRYTGTEFDRYIFCISLLAEKKLNMQEKKYIAELACLIGGDDTEFCGALALCSGELGIITQPCVRRISTTRRSDGSLFPEIRDKDIDSAVLQAQMKSFFPELEKFRMNFIKEKSDEISKHLPVRNCFGEILCEPTELELSDLYAIAKKDRQRFSDYERNVLNKYKGFRNKLAHQNTLSREDIIYIIK